MLTLTTVQHKVERFFPSHLWVTELHHRTDILILLHRPQGQSNHYKKQSGVRLVTWGSPLLGAGSNCKLKDTTSPKSVQLYESMEYFYQSFTRCSTCLYANNNFQFIPFDRSECIKKNDSLKSHYFKIQFVTMVNINLFKNNCVGYLSKFFLFNIKVSFLLLNSTILRKLIISWK